MGSSIIRMITAEPSEDVRRVRRLKPSVKNLLSTRNELEITITGKVASVDFEGTDTIRVIG
jgi:hypothetical protein